ncbi:ASCH domain-containing protein [Nesterenkonia halobia]|uniref:ASCH domain-containing protein n=2 Tax=Nesterenkonia halobia TaxID=37922 RepID=A0ABP6RH95_9MICC
MPRGDYAGLMPSATAPHPLTPPDAAAARALWKAWVSGLPDAQTPAEAYALGQFGDHRAMADELLDLVLRGVKTATASLLAEYRWEGETPPSIGAHTVFCDGSGVPRVIVRTTRLEIRRFDAVDADHARAEGEGDRSLAHWRAEHRAFWDRICTAAGTRFAPEMEVVLEHFAVVWPPAEDSARHLATPG